MSSVPPPSQSGAPSSGGNGTYIAVAILLLLGIGGIVVWKFSSKSPPPPKPVVASATVSASASAVSTALIDEVPLPPPVEEAGPPTTVKYVGGGDPCAVKACYGNVPAGSDSERGLGLLAHQTRRKCYDPALANDPTLKGHVTVRMKIAANGQICSASVIKNDMSSSSVGECAARMLLAAGHVAPPKGGCVELNFPLNYVPMGQH
jgi:hypothetical protein